MLEETNISELELQRLNEAINERYNYDFSNYAQSSYSRRISRILKLYDIKNVHTLQEKVVSETAFFNEFLRAVTVNTTEMFRDPEFWKALREDVIPQIRQHDVIRIWHAGCSTGEEVYSMAILLQEEGIYDKAKIFASDINDKVIETAKEGRYHIRNLERDMKNYEVFGGRNSFSDYYTKEDQEIVMNRDLFSNVITKKHDLVKGDIFSKFDIILCRNVIIYFNKRLQDEVFNLFIKGLYTGGYLAIGSKESLIWSSSADSFTPVNVRNNIFKFT